MHAQSKWLLALLLMVALGAGGCGKKKQDAGAEAMETPDADTATVDDGSNAGEAAPVLDEEKPPAEEAAATTEAPKLEEPKEVRTSGELATYTVQKGDTLMKIAFNIYGDIGQWKSLYDW